MSVILFIASIPSGAFAYGFSATATPLLLIRYTNRQISPILNFIEIFQNIANVMLNFRNYTKKSLTITIYGIPGIAIGSLLGAYLLKISVNDALLKVIVYSVLIPLILLQAAGFRKEISLDKWKKVGYLVTFPVGVLYGVSTISGPSLALIINNQGLTKEEFKFAISALRVAESITTFSGYLTLGVFSAQVLYYVAITSPAVITGMAIGVVTARIIKRKEDFRRLVMSFDSWVSGYGLSFNLGKVIGYDVLYWPMIVVIAIDLYLLSKYIVKRKKIVREID
ncbi:sulfite exporter TauE/SafE family protein [Saccharolobus islandicus]|uniref:sulfite exporter TauE/SafE family protein n=1 Tax=Saccharolobus islandicus TaxID=43080 RepID=UPI00036D4777|nr:sulfite exporter TauE/SafE family protein [Sulfolobus islandicus]